MIVDHIRHLGRYAHLFDGAEKIAEFLVKNPLQTLSPAQEYPVPGTDYRISPTVMEPKSFESKRWEGHRRHADLHLVAQGREYLGWLPITQLKMPSDYVKEADVEFYDDPLPGSKILLEEGYFAIFLPEDIHKPLLEGDGSGGIKILLKAKA